MGPRVFIHTKALQVLVFTHEKTNLAYMDDYFTRKFAVIQAQFIIGRSYAAEPKCLPEQTLFDAWKDDTIHVCALAVYAQIVVILQTTGVGSD